ncbi:HAMP domain-containing protein [Streptomyces alkaliphilus]|uniref:Signal transduction histidine-protein kinase/phosphatase MprB n=1 Tax=Streptomyces alkaliphilus TaxID=1472722 RepID=A0A7W3Y336_9ACTN|nr:HAMP domain-containing sensor histidine kinase [Streptomyces alkaliphilus]MBB0246193.1 HAMP domain-containing protein [Streptomyces alkaliphilus]
MRWALVRIALAVTSMVVVAFAVPLGMVIQQMANDRALSNAERQAAAIGPALAITSDRDQLERAVASTDAGAGRRIALHLPQEWSENPGIIGGSRVTEADITATVRDGRAVSLSVEGGVALLQPIAVEGGLIAVVEVFVPDDELSAGVGTARLVLAAVGLALIIGSVAVADRLGRRMVRPAEDLAAAARGLGEGRLGVRVPEQGPDELRLAASAFNAMARQVAGLLAGEREMAADLSHRLRTPLTVLRLNAASLGEGTAAEQTRQAVDQLEREVDVIIEAAREHRTALPEGMGAVPVEDTDVTEVIRERMDFWSALAEDEGREVRLAGVEEPARVPVPRAELVAALDAMLGNVFRHTPEGTAFAVDVHSGDGSNAVIVLVSDAGPGIPDPEAALARGHGDGGPGSTGLGLDIVRRVAESTGGDVRIGQSVLGGAEIRVWLSRDGRVGGRDGGRHRAVRRRARA